MKIMADAFTIKHTAFNSFQEMLDAAGGYFPTLETESGTKESHERQFLANMYDEAQVSRGDSRKAYRWGKKRMVADLQVEPA